MFRQWLVAYCLCACLVVISVLYIDQPVATYAAGFHLYHGMLASLPLQLPVLVALMILAVLLGGLSVTLKPRVPPWVEALVQTGTLAGLAMAWGLCLTEFLIKPLFGRTLPDAFLQDGTYGFHWFQRGDEFGSFPSGHAVQITSIVSVFWILYPRWRPLYALAVGGVALALILGERHFVSDIIAGSMVGVGAGVLITRLWRERKWAASSLAPLR